MAHSHVFFNYATKVEVQVQMFLKTGKRMPRASAIVCWYTYPLYVASLLHVPRHPGEEGVEYCKRRNRSAGLFCKTIGLWSHRWYRRSLTWHAHLLRPLNRHTWSALLVQYRGKQWLQERRSNFVGSCTAGRTKTRSFLGPPCVRWHDGVDFAEEMIK